VGEGPYALAVGDFNGDKVADAVGDFDGDGRPDLALAGTVATGGRVYILMNESP